MTKSPKLDALTQFIVEKKASGELPAELSEQLKELLIDQHFELGIVMDIFNQRKMWLGFILGIIATIAISSIGAAIYFDYFSK